MYGINLWIMQCFAREKYLLFIYLMRQVTVDVPYGLHFVFFRLYTYCIWIYDPHLTSDILKVLSS
jgi:hypothetical protein